MNVVLAQEPAPHRLPSPTLEEYVVRDDDRGRAAYLQQALDVLKKVELFVRCGGPEVVALVGLALAGGPGPPVPQAGSQMVVPGPGRIASTMASISGRGVKYCPAPLFTSASISNHVSPCISEIKRFSFAGSCILFCALRKMVPSIPGSRPSSSRTCL